MQENNTSKPEHHMGASWSNQDDALSARLIPQQPPGATGPASGSDWGKYPDASAMTINIFKYFNDIGYPKISTPPKLIYAHKLGAVYLVEFEPGAVVSQKPCYAIVIDGKVSGYNQDFWSDADKYRLILKQHLGLLEMEKSEAKECEDEFGGLLYKRPSDQKQCDGVKNGTMDAIVGRYEEMLAAKDREIQSLNATIKERDASMSKISLEKGYLERKLAGISEVIAGTSTAIPNSGPPPEKSPVACVIDQDEFIDDNGATQVAHGAGYLGPNESKWPATTSGERGAYGVHPESDIVSKDQNHSTLNAPLSR